MRAGLATLYRSLTRDRQFALLNIAGLALGIAAFLTLFLFVQFERGYDRQFAGWERLWVVKRSMQFAGAPRVEIPSAPDTLAQMRAEYRGVDGTRQLIGDAALLTESGASTVALAQVDANYFRLFPMPVRAGDPAAALARPDGAVVTRRLARDFLGTASPLGRAVTLVVAGEQRRYRIVAVLGDLPANRSFKADVYVPLPSGGEMQALGRQGTLTTFLAFDTEQSARAVAADFPQFTRRHRDPGMTDEAVAAITQSMQPLAALHLAQPRDRVVVGAIAMVGLLALAVAIANYVNLATARAGTRAREVALRKMFGATPRALLLHFLAEAAVAVLLAALVGLALAELWLPMVNMLGGTDLAIVYFGAGSILPALALLVLAVTVAAGLYPAAVLARFQPAAVLAASQSGVGGRSGARLRRALVLVQFTIAIALAITTAVLVAQNRHLARDDLGFRREGLILVPSYAASALDAAQRSALLRAFQSMPEVQGFTLSGQIPGGGSMAIGHVQRDHLRGPAPMITQVETGPDFFRTYGARLLAGRVFEADHALDNADGPANDRTLNVVVNRAAAGALQFARPGDAIGALLTLDDGQARVIGVVDDMRFGSPRDPVEPLLYFHHAEQIFAPVATLRARPGATQALLDRLVDTWRAIAPAVPLDAVSVVSRLDAQYYRDDRQRARLFTLGSVLALAIGCIGLYGLAAFDTARRTREIGIRKALGASTRDILRLLILQFLRPVLLANLIAWPIAWFAMRAWLAGFDERVALSPVYFIAAGGLAVLIAAATVTGEAWRMARAEPARALRYE